MPIGSHKDNRDGLVVCRVGDGRPFAAARAGVPEDAEVFRPWPCAALAHAHCNLSKGATRVISRWRHASLPPVVVGVAESGARFAVPGPVVLAAARLGDWAVVEQEAYDRGVEALRRQGHRWQGHEMTIAERREEQRRLDRAHSAAARDAALRDLAAEHGPRIAALTDWQAVISEHEDVLRRLRCAATASLEHAKLSYLATGLGERRRELWSEEAARLRADGFADEQRARWGRAHRSRLDRRGAILGAKAKRRSLRPAEHVELEIIDEIKAVQDRHAEQEARARRIEQYQQRIERIERLLEGPFTDEFYEQCATKSDEELLSIISGSPSQARESPSLPEIASAEEEAKSQIARSVLQQRQQKRRETSTASAPAGRGPQACIDCGKPTYLMDVKHRPRCACTLQEYATPA